MCSEILNRGSLAFQQPRQAVGGAESSHGLRSQRQIEGRKTLMNKGQLEETVLRGGFAREEAAARQVNAEPWQPPTGMVKLRCAGCHYWFAAPHPGATDCPDCEIKRQRRLAAATAPR
jgi:hypothetical protein